MKMPRVRRRTWVVAVAGILIVPVLLLLVLDLIFPLPAMVSDYSTVVYSRNGELLHGFLNEDDKWRIRADYEDISEDLRDAIVLKEDRYFFYHPGINPLSVVRAGWNNMIKGRRTSGASTITMQLARLTEPAPRTLVNKIRESFRALQFELHYSKKEILAMYLNILPYGGNIEGVKSASLIYFNQEPDELSPAQIVTLTVIPNNPNYLNPVNSGNLLRERDKWLQRFYRMGIFTEEEFEDAKNEEVVLDRVPIPREVPHLARRLVKGNLTGGFSSRNLGGYSAGNSAGNSSAGNSGSDQVNGGQGFSDRIYTTIDQKVQVLAETTLSNYIRSLRTIGVTNGAVIIIDNRTMEVVSYVGSAGFNETEYSGQVDGVRALRSPGSTLKPALYLLAFDKGLVSPKTAVSDVPVNFSGYRPENYDESYRGKVSIEEALALSLNVPAVELLDELGVAEMQSLLERAGFKWIAKNKKKTGLSLILGGCGTTLEELAGLYAAFSNKGVWNPLKFTTNKGMDRLGIKSKNEGFRDQAGKVHMDGGSGVKNVGIKISSPGSAYMITQILTGLKRPDLPFDYVESAQLPMIAWKTGTSYGRRDAWAVGYNAEYTVGVWTGNFNGRGVAELNGTDCAVPILFSIFNQLGSRESDWFFPTEDTDFRLVCQETGMVADTFCHNLVMETYLPGISPSIRCNHLNPVFTNAAETVAYCSECMPESGYKTTLYPNYKPEMINYLEERHIPFKRIPGHNANCTAIRTEEGPRITSLTNGAEYLIFAGRKQKLALKCQPENGVRTVYWYIDGKFLEKSDPTETVYFDVTKGRYSITCSDDRGQTSSIGIVVTVI